MTQLVEDLLFLARNDAPSSEIPRAQLDVGELIRGVAAELRSVAEVRKIKICLTKPDSRGVAPLISGHEAALRRLFLVLLDNALKYSRPGSDVMVAISVRDSRTRCYGPGFWNRDQRGGSAPHFQTVLSGRPGKSRRRLWARAIAGRHYCACSRRRNRGEERRGKGFNVQRCFSAYSSANFAEGIQRKLEILN